MENKYKMELTPELLKAIEDIVNRRNRAEVGVKNGKLCVWEVQSKTKYERPLA